MKVVDVTEFYSERGGGVRSYLESKQHILCQLGHESLLVVPGPVELSRPGLVRVGGPRLPYDATYHLMWRPDKIRDLAGIERPDVLEIHSPYVAAVGALMARARSFGIRTFVWHSDFIDTYERVLISPRPWARPVGPVLRGPLWSWVRRIADGCAATFCASRWQTEKLVGQGVARVVHLPFGVDREAFSPGPADEVERARWLGAGRGPLLVAVGRLAVEKRWEVVIDAAARLASGAELVVLGDGPELGRLKARAGRNVHFAGFLRDRTELARILRSADALVHGCPHETFGIAVAEAIASGLPVVVPDEGGAAEQAPPGASERYATGDAEACAAAVARLLARRDAARAAAADAARSVLSTREHFEALLGHYEELLARARA